MPRRNRRRKDFYEHIGSYSLGVGYGSYCNDNGQLTVTDKPPLSNDQFGPAYGEAPVGSDGVTGSY